MDTPTALVLVAAIGAIPSTLACILSARNGKAITAKSAELDDKLTQIHKDVNGKVDKLIQASKAGDIAEGKAAGIEQERGEERKRKTHK